jgi:lysophospholipase L1-like esterase
VAAVSLCTHVDPKRGQCKRGAHSSGFHVYKPLRLVGRKARRERSDLDRARAAVKARSQGFCEAHDLIEAHSEWISDANEVRRRVCATAILHAGDGAHHVFPEDRDAGVHDPARMLFLCETGHRWSHGHPTAAAALGLLRPTRSTTT